MPIPSIVAAIIAALQSGGALAAGGAEATSGVAEGIRALTEGGQALAQSGGLGGGGGDSVSQQPHLHASPISDLFSAVGNVAGGAASMAGDALAGMGIIPGKEGLYPDWSTKGMRQRSERRQSLADEFNLLRSTENPDEQAEILATIQQNPLYKKFLERRTAVRESSQQPVSVLSPRDEAANAGYRQLTSEEQKELVLNPRGYGQMIVDPVKQAEGYLRVANISADEELSTAATEKAKELIMGKGLEERNPELHKYFTEDKVTMPEGKFPPKQYPSKSVPSSIEQQVKDVSEYFQSETPIVPEKNMPKTYNEIGLMDVSDQATLQEMQAAIPERDLKKEYEQDPEGMKRLMELWRKKKLNKNNLHKAFTMIQQQAKESLGVA